MFKTRYKILTLTVMVSLSAYAIDEQSIRADLKSDKVTNKNFTLNDKDMSLYIHHRKGGKGSSLSNPEYFYFWHGDQQTAYPFMNLTTIMSNNDTLNKRSAISLSLDSHGDRWTSSDGDSIQVLNSIGKQYKHVTDFRNEVSVGFDTGVAQAYRFACQTNKGVLVAVAGGLYEHEECASENLSILYVLNEGDLVFPFDKDNSFAAGARPSLTERLDGGQTLNKLKELLNCSSVVESQARKSTTFSYNCENDNQLFVVKGDNSYHQWNGYSNVSEGAYGMEGKPQKPDVTHWLYSEFGVK